MDLNLSAFQEPRGVMRIFQFIFAICAFATTTNYTGFVEYFCNGDLKQTYPYYYPFRLSDHIVFQNCTGGKSEQVNVIGSFSSDAQFFVATGVLSMLYALAISVIYAKFDDKYKSNAQWPLIDFSLTVVLAVLWLSGSAAWANGLNGLKTATSPPIPDCKNCSISSSSFSSLDISVILGFLNFFLWASDLWFLYKETEWFQEKQAAPAATTPTM
ncbi:hypothetical protein CBL_13805 [Carabus blaptoides fortunei]